MSSVRHPSRLLRRLLIAVTVSLLAGPAIVAVPSHGVVEATRARSSSTEVAALASEALDALGVWMYTGEPLQYVDFLAARDRAAGAAAAELGLDPIEVATAWTRTHPTKQVALLGALTQLGVPYRSRMSKEGVGFDCSGLTTYAWARAGVDLTRSSGDQIRQATVVDRAEASAGDLVYYPGHVMMYLGVGDAIVHSPNSGNLVEITFVTDRRANTVVYADPLR